MKGYIHIESMDTEGALRCEANLSDVSTVDRYQVLDAACRLLNRDFAVRATGALDQCIAQSKEASVMLMSCCASIER